MSEIVKIANILKFNNYSSYMFIHSESYNKYEFYYIYYNLDKLPNKVTLLDIGCGYGNIIRMSKDVFKFIIGIDISEITLNTLKKLLNCKNTLLNIDLIVADVETMPFRQNTIDAVTAYSIIHHLPNINKSLTEIHRVLKLGGVLIAFHEPNYWGRCRVYYRGPIYKFNALLYKILTLKYLKKKIKSYMINSCLKKLQEEKSCKRKKK